MTLTELILRKMQHDAALLAPVPENDDAINVMLSVASLIDFAMNSDPERIKEVVGIVVQSMFHGYGE